MLGGLCKVKVLYIDTSASGISGDMFLAALLELTAKRDQILEELSHIKDYLPDVSYFEVSLESTTRNGLKVNRLNVEIKERKHHRTPKQMKDALVKFLEDHGHGLMVKDYVLEVFNTLIRAETEVHDEIEKNIHLHELSSIDTILDIIGCALILEEIGVLDHNLQVFTSKLPLGGGTIKTVHGLLPVPAPATLSILKSSNISITLGPIDSELVTPTGAALLINLKPEPIDADFTLNNVVYSTGQKQFVDFPNILRLLIGEVADSIDLLYLRKYQEIVAKLETDVDDVSGEVIGNFIRLLENRDILDIQVIPSITKKSRTSHIIKILCHPSKLPEMMMFIFKNLGTLGIRYELIKRVCIDRVIEKIAIQIQGKKYEITYKISFIARESGKEIVNIKPEYQDLKRISEELNLPFIQVMLYVQEPLKSLYGKYNINE
jgi:uncharacterized protein (TIGR00299 family) protein